MAYEFNRCFGSVFSREDLSHIPEVGGVNESPAGGLN